MATESHSDVLDECTKIPRRVTSRIFLRPVSRFLTWHCPLLTCKRTPWSAKSPPRRSWPQNSKRGFKQSLGRYDRTTRLLKSKGTGTGVDIFQAPVIRGDIERMMYLNQSTNVTKRRSKDFPALTWVSVGRVAALHSVSSMTAP